MSTDSSSGKTVLVTGGAGFLASHLVPALLARGDKVIAQDVLSSDQAVRIKPLIESKAITYRWQSVVDIVPKDLEGVDLIIHTAALTDVPLSNTSPTYTRQINYDSMVSLTSVLKQTKTPILCMSTENVYGAVPENRLPADESEPSRPKNAYAASKVAMEAILHSSAVQNDVPVGVIRSSTLFGEMMRTKQVVAIFIRQAIENKAITIEGDGSQTRDFNYVSNMVDAHLLLSKRLLEQTKGGFGVWNIGAGREMSLKELIDIIRSLSNSSSAVEYKPWRPGEEGRLCLSIEKAKADLGYSPKVSVEEGLQKTIDWFRLQSAPPVTTYTTAPVMPTYTTTVTP